MIILVLFGLAFDLSSMATFLGLLSAGLAISFHNVVLSIGALPANHLRVSRMVC